MPVSYYWEDDGFVMEAKGNVMAEEVFEANDAFLKVPEGVAPKYQLLNALEVNEVNISELELVDLSADDLSTSRKYPNLKIALVGHEGSVMENFIIYLKVSWAMNTNWDIRIFNSLEAARYWLGQGTG